MGFLLKFNSWKQKALRTTIFLARSVLAIGRRSVGRQFGNPQAEVAAGCWSPFPKEMSFPEPLGCTVHAGVRSEQFDTFAFSPGETSLWRFLSHTACAFASYSLIHWFIRWGRVTWGMILCLTDQLCAQTVWFFFINSWLHQKGWFKNHPYPPTPPYHASFSLWWWKNYFRNLFFHN